MKTYTMDKPGIFVVDGKIHVGETGRGRKLVSVPIPPKSVLESDQKQDVLVEVTGSETSALVLIPDQSGYRGCWHLRDARTEEEWAAVIEGCKCPSSWDHTPECPIPPQRESKAKIIAEGFRAQGAAGRMGGGPEYLLILEHGQAVEIVRSGRLYGSPSVVRLENRAGLVILSDPRKDAEERAASRRWEDLATAAGGEPNEISQEKEPVAQEGEGWFSAALKEAKKL